MNKEKVICPCKNVTKGDIIKSIKNGASSYKSVKKMTGAGSKCGKCEKDIRKLIKKIQADAD